MFIAMSMIPAGDLAGKLLTGSYGASPVFVAWSRFLIGMAILLPFVRFSAFRLLADWRLWLRALLITCGILSIQTALRTEPLANVFAAFFVGPIVSFTLSAVLLREPAGLWRSLLMLLGFCGVLLVVRPGIGGSGGLIWAALAGSFYGAYLTASRWVAKVGSPLEITFTQLVMSALILAPLGLASLPAPSWPVAGLAATSAAFSMAGNLLLLWAYSRTVSTRLAPLVYFQLIAATGLGWAVFGDFPDPITIAGLVLIIGAGLVSASLRR
ncbi:DMT family transporter [Albibacillus kandeliae]|uniref:DMT family transporter n=1 Tax=Albibacillus kandeliae TaxID=2174228 RepID=UPI001E5B4FD5|nr:DMT family transporter [Albibacillus kandeliae]